MLLRRQFVLSGLAVACGTSQAAFREPLGFAAAAVRFPEQRSLLAVAVAGNRLVAVGMRGLIVASEDGGASWRQVPLALSSDLVSVVFATSQRGWACGHDGVVLTTDDGGRTWTEQLKGMDFANILLRHYEKAAAAGQSGAAENLQSIKLSFAAGPEQPVLGVWFDNETTGWAVSTFGMILGTTDAGKSWSPWMDQVDNVDLLHFYSIAGVAGAVYITSERGRLFKLDRARRRFVAIDTGYQGGLFGVIGTPEVLIAFGLQGTALRSKDGGATWQRLETGLRVGLNAGVALPDRRMVMVSQDGRLLVTADQGSSFQLTRVPRPGLLTGIAVAEPSQLIVVGFNGVQLVQA
jgi:photosystem II stability/assembly factor-like uncharacterized protein